MSVNDKELKERVRKAGEYFSKLKNQCYFEGGVERGVKIDNTRIPRMLETVAYAANVFGYGYGRKEIDNVLLKNGVVVPMAVPSGVSTSHVIKMCKEYACGRREFDRYSLEQAERLCHALLSFVGILEENNFKWGKVALKEVTK